ncbi:MAG: response regulator [Chloroflexaceae bacterium]|nr:response regulator [Chloroflexaceae bacterium]
MKKQNRPDVTNSAESAPHGSQQRHQELQLLQQRVAELEARERHYQALLDESSLLLSHISELEHENEYYQVIMDQTPVLISYVDTYQRYQFVNRLYEEWFGLSRNEIRGRHVYDVIGSISYERVRHHLEQVLKGEAVIHEFVMQRKDGQERHLRSTYIPHMNQNNQVLGFFVLGYDITQDKQTEIELLHARDAAEAANRAKSEFLANTSHEIRTPLNVIIGMTNLLLSTNLDEEQQEFSRSVLSSGNALLSIINDILDLSRIESGKLDVETQPFYVRDCVEESFDILLTNVGEKDIDLIYTIDDDVPTNLAGDHTRLRQILTNIIGNAIKFTESGEVVVRVSSVGLDPLKIQTQDSHALGQYWKILFSVRDTGIGIPSDCHHKIFQSFSQVDASTTRRYGGTGLGLAISKHLVERMGGSIWFESEVGTGSTFYFTITAYAMPDQPDIARSGIQPHLAHRRLLIVDDNTTMAHLLVDQVSRWGMQPQVATSALEALDLLQQHVTFDVALIDLHLPDIDGFRLAQAIQTVPNLHGEVQPIPVILMARARAHHPHYQNEHIQAILYQPIRPALLHQTLSYASTPATTSHPTTTQSDETKPLLGMDLAHRRPLRILLAEDNTISQRVILRLLQRMGYQADVVVNGFEVLHALEQQRYDVVLMDMQMPDMDGSETTETIRHHWPHERQPWIIALTANIHESDRETYLTMGMNGLIGKPVNMEHLVAALEQVQPIPMDNRRSENDDDRS